MGRGALVVLEGCDRAGKSTQVKMLLSALQNLGIPAESRRFPGDYKIISYFLYNFEINSTIVKSITVRV